MEKKHIFGLLSILSFASVLFTPMDSGIWALFMVLGIVFGFLWFKFK